MDHKEAVRLCLEIIATTNDGNNLSDWEINVVEWAGNGFLNEQGKGVLREIHVRYCGEAKQNG